MLWWSVAMGLALAGAPPGAKRSKSPPPAAIDHLALDVWSGSAVDMHGDRLLVVDAGTYAVLSPVDGLLLGEVHEGPRKDKGPNPHLVEVRGGALTADRALLWSMQTAYAADGADGHAVLRAVATSNVRLRTAAMAPDGERFAVAWDNALALYERDGSVWWRQHEVTDTGPVRGVAHTGDRVITSSGNGLQVRARSDDWSVEGEVRIEEGHLIAFAADPHRIAALVADTGWWRVEVFDADAGWARSAVLELEEPDLTSTGAAKVDVQGDRILVGLPGVGRECGRAWLFEKERRRWRYRRVDDPGGCEVVLFGSAVALGEDTLAVGAAGFQQTPRLYLFASAPR